MKHYPDNLNYYNEYKPRPKIVVKVDSEEELLEIYKKAKDAKLPCHLVVDAGRTEIEPGSKTVVAIGPGYLISGIL
jgi:peptidyl-tRNA hydrolase